MGGTYEHLLQARNLLGTPKLQNVEDVTMGEGVTSPLTALDLPGYVAHTLSLNVLNKLLHFVLVQSIAVEKSDDNLSFYYIPKELFPFFKKATNY